MTRKRNLMFAAAAALAVLTGGSAAQVRDGAAPQRAPAFPALDDLQATRDRPLFSPGRRPPEVAATPDVPDAPPPVQEAASLPFELTGTVIGAELKVAILRDRQTQEEVRLREGEEHGPWKIEEVAARYVLFRNEGRRVRLRLFDQTAKAGDHVKVRRSGGDEDESVTPEEPVSTETEAIEEEVVPDQAPEARPANEPAPRPQQRSQRRNLPPDEVAGRQPRRQLNAEQLQRQQMREQMRQQRQQARQQPRQDRQIQPR